MGKKLTLFVLLGLVILSLTFALSQSNTQTGEHPFILSWGSYGSGFGQFRSPMGVTISPDGLINVSQYDSPCRVQRFTSQGTYISQFGSCGSPPPVDGTFILLVDVATDDAGNFYTIEALGARVQKFSPTGTFLMKWGGYGAEDGKFNHPSGIAIGNESVYVVDRLNNRIQRFDMNGSFIGKWGSYGTGSGQFTFPNRVAVDEIGNVYVSDKNHIQKFTSDGSFISAFGSYGSGDGQFMNPNGVAFDVFENIYVVDTENHRVQKFSKNFVFLTKWGSLGMAPAPGVFFGPTGIAIESPGYIYIADTNNHRIQKFGPGTTGVKIDNTTWGQLKSLFR